MLTSINNEIQKLLDVDHLDRLDEDTLRKAANDLHGEMLLEHFITLAFRYKNYVEYANNIRANYKHDIELISDKLIEEANERQWCGLYDDFVAKLNGRLIQPLKTRQREYKVTRRFTATATHYVTACNEEEAEEIVENNYSTYEAEIYHVDDVDVELDNTEIEEV